MNNLDFEISFSATLLGAGTNCGYGYTAVQLIEAWQRAMHPVWWELDTAPVNFSFTQPHSYDYKFDRVNIGYTPWESTKLPDAWPQYMNKMTEIWTTSAACEKWFINNGVEKPIRVLEHGINREHWPIKKRIRKSEPFRFLHIGAGTKRKGAQMAYEAFKNLYADNDEVILILKGEPQFDIECSNVYVIDQQLPLEDLVRLYMKAHALIYPGNGEGFGLIPFQAAATGMPTLVTDWGGPQDFMQYCWPIRVERLIECDYEPHEGLWALPDQQELEYQMQELVCDQEYFFDTAYRRASQMYPKYSWDRIAKKSLGWMKELLES